MSTQDPGASPSLPELPWAFIDCPTDTLIILISHMLDLLIQHNDQVILTPDSLTRFHSRAAPGISVIEYLRRIVKYTNMEKIPLLSLLAYIDITCQHLPTFTLSSLTVHRFLIAGVCAGSKAQCDVFCTNAHYAKVGGIKVQELNALEKEFLKVTQWNVNCTADLLQRYYSSLIRSHGGYTQAPQPATSPFVSFPRSQSKPRSTEPVDGEREYDLTSDVEGPGKGEDDEDMEGDGDESVSEYGSSPVASSSKRASFDIPMKDGSATSPASMRGRTRRRSGHGHARKLSTSLPVTTATGMDVDPPDDRSSASSIPSSSRSSLRGSRSSIRGGRAPSLTYSDPKLAEPRIDTTPATGQGAAWVTDVPPEGGDQRVEAGDKGREEGDNTNSHHHHVGGKLLRNFVGGIFHHSHHGGGDHNHKHPPPAQVPPPQPPQPPQPPKFGQPATIHPSEPIRPPPAPNPGTIRSPPLPKGNTSSTAELPRAIPVTPKVRTRSEVSVHPRNLVQEQDGDAVALGPSTVQGVGVGGGGGGGGGGVGDGGGDGGDGVDGGVDGGVGGLGGATTDLGVVLGDTSAGGIAFGRAGDVVDPDRVTGKRGRLV